MIKEIPLAASCASFEFLFVARVSCPSSSSSFHGFITNQFNDLLPVGLLAYLVERCTCIAEVKSLNPVQA